ncbi:MAG: DUF3822 family protein [Arcicella sp.]|nr:DUF3822 family protein [Arcicella sp.]
MTKFVAKHFVMQTATLHIPPTEKFEIPGFDIEKLSQYQLSCEVSESSFACSVIDIVDNQTVVSEKYDFPASKENHSIAFYLTQIYATHDFLKSLRWKAIEIIIDNQSFTLVPTDLFKKEYTNRYLQLAKGLHITDVEEVQICMHEDLGIVNVYSSERELYNWFSGTYPLIDLKYQHKTSQMIDLAIFISKAQTAFLYFGNHHFTMVITANGALKFCNRFEYKTAQDLVYYVLFTMNELEIEPDEIILRLYGNIKEQTEDFDLLNQYLTNVKIGI